MQEAQRDLYFNLVLFIFSWSQHQIMEIISIEILSIRIIPFTSVQYFAYIGVLKPNSN